MRIKLTVNYKNGNSLTELVNYIHFEDGKIHYTVDKQEHGLIQDIVKIPLDNVATYDLEKLDIEGWDYE